MFNLAIDRAHKTSILQDRLKNLNDEFTKVLYNNICQSLFEKDKLLFSFLLCVRILQVKGEMDSRNLRYFLQGNTSVELSKPNPLAGSWLSDKAWGDILGAAGLDGGLAGVDEMLEKRPDDFRALFNSQSPKEDIISLFGDKINALEVLILLRCLRPDKVVPALQDL